MVGRDSVEPGLAESEIKAARSERTPYLKTHWTSLCVPNTVKFDFAIRSNRLP